MYVVKILCCLLVVCQLTLGKRIKGYRAADQERAFLQLNELHVSSSVFGLFLEGEDTCTVDPLQLHTLTSCGFNSSNPLIIITHGWSLDGMMESWVFRLAKALKTSLPDINVVITDWLKLAKTHYATAAQSTRTVGKDIATLLQLLQVHYQYPVRKVHLIGYSLGAHISGFTGGYFQGPQKIGRITGLDPAGPLFEGMSPTDRLSPDDADFVDAIHTFTHQRMGLSVGIQQAVAHYDFYPNGGHYQPGCDIKDLYDHITIYGMQGFQQTVKCAHERSVHLFIDSLLNEDKQSMAYRCSDEKAFNKGVCLDCRRNRCNTLGYNIRKVRSSVSKRLFLKTGPRMPYKLFHYQFKIQFVNQMEEIEPLLTISLTGTNDESGNLPITVNEMISGNKTFTFLITLDKDLGDLMLLKMHWETTKTWKNMWKQVVTIVPWAGLMEQPQLSVGSIRVKAGETQERTSFCPMTGDGQQIIVSDDKMFVRCQDNKPRPHKRRHK